MPRQTFLSGTRTFLRNHDDMPAFHASLFVVTLLIAALLNLGIFLLVIVVHILADMYTLTGKPRRFTRALRGSIVDLLLFCVGLTCAVFLHPSGLLVAMSGLLRAQAAALYATGTVLPRFLMLRHVTKRESLEATRLRTERRWSLLERASLFLIPASLIIVAFAPQLGIPHDLYWRILEQKLVPWNV